jgi:soluble lytic murein transglycosylase-like protein
MDTDALQRLDALLSDPQVPQADKNRAVAMARTQEASSATTTTTTSGPGFPAGQYLTSKGSQFVGALQGVQKDIQNVVTGQPYGAGFPGQRSGWETAGDIVQTAAPLVAPELTSAGLAAGTLTRQLGGSEQTADIANVGTQLLGGGIDVVSGAARAVKGAPAALKAAAQAKYATAAEQAAQGGRTLAMGTKEGDTFATALSDAVDWSGAHPAERAMAKPLLNKLTAPGSPGLTYAELDDALAGLRKIRGPSYVRGLVDDAAQSLLEGTPAGKARLAAKATWKSLKAKPFQRGGQLALGVAGGEVAAREALQGHYKRAAGTLALTAAGGVALKNLTGRGLMTAAGGAAGPLARTAVAGTAQIPGLANAPAGATEADVSPALPPSEEPAPTGQAPPPRGLTALPGPYGREIAAVASLVKIPPQLIQAHMKLESGGNAGAIGDQGRSIGLMQIQPGTAATVAPQAGALLGRAPNLRNPLDNLVVGGLLLRRYLDKTNGDVHAAAQLYNGGEHTSGNAHTRWYGDTIVKNYTGAIRETPLEPLSESGVGG